ncbi:hypothetical protein M408DRAFT_28026 [Serendipita vermifera MAFF 305830]|uniref:Uncharacterized protein n=1 Tax=Serendipita vermifera MAFF 305830 TaxID=933852 RepID=A0A0C3AVF3_SERVB|nr:hypothetical protein M408DRAFT_28026 [Serendipita vermifera MAFF 305830]
MRIQVAPLVLLFASVALAAPVPTDSERSSLERRGFAGEEEALELFQRGLRSPTALFPEHSLSRGRSPTRVRSNSKHLRSSSGSSSLSRSASRDSSLASSRRGNSKSRSRSPSPAFGLKSTGSQLFKRTKGKKDKDPSYHGRGPSKNNNGPPQTRAAAAAAAAAQAQTNAKGHPTTGGLRLPGPRLARRVNEKDDGNKDYGRRGRAPDSVNPTPKERTTPPRGCNPNKGVGTKWCDRDPPRSPPRDAKGRALTGGLTVAKNPNRHNVKRALRPAHGAPAHGGGAPAAAVPPPAPPAPAAPFVPGVRPHAPPNNGPRMGGHRP